MRNHHGRLHNKQERLLSPPGQPARLFSPPAHRAQSQHRYNHFQQQLVAEQRQRLDELVEIEMIQREMAMLQKMEQERKRKYNNIIQQINSQALSPQGMSSPKEFHSFIAPQQQTPQRQIQGQLELHTSGLAAHRGQPNQSSSFQGFQGKQVTQEILQAQTSQESEEFHSFFNPGLQQEDQSAIEAQPISQGQVLQAPVDEFRNYFAPSDLMAPIASTNNEQIHSQIQIHSTMGDIDPPKCQREFTPKDMAMIDEEQEVFSKQHCSSLADFSALQKPEEIIEEIEFTHTTPGKLTLRSELPSFRNKDQSPAQATPLASRASSPEEEKEEDIDLAELHQQFEQARLEEEAKDAKEVSIIDEICLKESSGKHSSEAGEIQQHDLSTENEFKYEINRLSQILNSSDFFSPNKLLPTASQVVEQPSMEGLPEDSKEEGGGLEKLNELPESFEQQPTDREQSPRQSDPLSLDDKLAKSIVDAKSGHSSQNEILYGIQIEADANAISSAPFKDHIALGNQKSTDRQSFQAEELKQTSPHFSQHTSPRPFSHEHSQKEIASGGVLLTSTLEPNIGQHEYSIPVNHLAAACKDTGPFQQAILGCKDLTDRVQVNPAISKQEGLSIESFIQSLNARLSPVKRPSLTSQNQVAVVEIEPSRSKAPSENHSRNRSGSVHSRMMSLHSMPLPSRPSNSASSRSRKIEPLPFSPAVRETARALSRASERRAIGLKSSESSGSDPICPPESDDPYMLKFKSVSPNKCPVQITSSLPKQPRGRGNFNQSQQINLKELYGKMGKRDSEGPRSGSRESKPAQSDFPKENPLSIGERVSRGDELKSRMSKTSYCSTVSRNSKIAREAALRIKCHLEGYELVSVGFYFCNGKKKKKVKKVKKKTLERLPEEDKEEGKLEGRRPSGLGSVSSQSPVKEPELRRGPPSPSPPKPSTKSKVKPPIPKKEQLAPKKELQQINDYVDELKRGGFGMNERKEEKKLYGADPPPGSLGKQLVGLPRETTGCLYESQRITRSNFDWGEVEKFAGNFPLHRCIINKRFHLFLIDLLLTSRLSVEQVNQQDFHGNTPLMIATKMIRYCDKDEALALLRIIDLLFKNEASLKHRDRLGWKCIHEAIDSKNPNLVALLFDWMERRRRAKWEESKTKIRERLRKIPDFYVELKWECDIKWLPFLSKVAPSDTLKIWKIGTCLRLDFQLVGFKKLQTKYRPMSVIFNEFGEQGDIALLNREKETVLNPLEDFDKEERIAVMTDMINSELVQNEVNVKNQKWEEVHSLFGGQKELQIGDYHSKRFRVTLQVQNTLSEKGTRVKSTLNPPDHLCFKAFSDLEKNQSPSSTQAKHFKSWMQGYFDEKKMNQVYAQYTQHTKGERQTATEVYTSDKTIRTELWLCKEFPLKFTEFMDVLDTLTIAGNANMIKIKEFLGHQVLQDVIKSHGFPVRVQVPVDNFVLATVTFQKFQFMRQDGGMKQSLKEQLFVVPREFQVVGRKEGMKTMKSKKKRMAVANLLS